MMFPFVDVESTPTETQQYPREYGIDFETGQLTGTIVEGVEALKVWAWLALQTPRYRYYVYSWNYGQEYEDMIGKGYSQAYMKMELERMTEECLTVNPFITGIERFTMETDGDHVTLSFLMVTSLGDTEVNASV